MKQVILCRKDLKMPKGKLAVQVAHASVHASHKANGKLRQKWFDEGATKVALAVKDEKELLDYKKKAMRAKIPQALIMDAGRTFFKQPTRTCLAIGPAKDEVIDKIVSKLKLM